MRPAAKIDEIALGVSGDLLAFVLFDELLLIRIGPEDFLGFVAGNFGADEGDVILRELLHFRFDGGEIGFRDDLVAEIHVVIIAFLDGGPETEFGLGVKVDNGLGHQVAGRVVQKLKGFRFALSHKRDFAAGKNWASHIQHRFTAFQGHVFALVGLVERFGGGKAVGSVGQFNFVLFVENFHRSLLWAKNKTPHLEGRFRAVPPCFGPSLAPFVP